MSTRCLIAVIDNDGTGQYVYCGSDGYPEWTGRLLLLTYYPTRDTGVTDHGARRSQWSRQGHLGIRRATPSAQRRNIETRANVGRTNAPKHLSTGLVELDQNDQRAVSHRCRIHLRICGKLLDGLHSRLSCVESVVSPSNAKRLCRESIWFIRRRSKSSRSEMLAAGVCANRQDS